MDKHKGTRTINSNTTADFHADYATLFVVLHETWLTTQPVRERGTAKQAQLLESGP
jgi:hypothetical protein